MNLDIVICTYNRPLLVERLITQLWSFSNQYNHILIIDSSDQSFKPKVKSNQLKVVRSSHKNQPYQRYLAKHISNAKYLLYLDDDMMLENNQLFTELDSIITKQKPIGIGIGFRNFVSTPTQIKNTSAKNNVMYRAFGQPHLSEGQYSWNGIRGPQPENIDATQWFSGGAFLIERTAVFENVDLRLLDLFEKKLGMGEDMIISHGSSRLGKVLFLPGDHFIHDNRNESHYSYNSQKLAIKFMISRLYINLQLAYWNNRSASYAIFRYILFSIGQILIRTVQMFRKPTVSSRQIVSGHVKGFFKSFSTIRSLQKEIWESSVKSDLMFYQKSLN